MKHADFLTIPVVYQVNIRKKGCRKSSIVNIVENIDFPIESLDSEQQPIGIFSLANISLPLTENDYNERLRRGDYLYFENNGQLLSSFVNILPYYNEISITKPMTSHIFSRTFYGKNNDDASSFIENTLSNETLNNKQKIEAYNNTLLGMGLTSEAINGEIATEIPNGAEILSDDRNYMINHFYSQIKDWRVMKERLYLPTNGPSVTISFSNGHPRMHIGQADIKNPTLENYKTYLSKHLNIVNQIEVPFSMVPDILEKLPNLEITYERSNMDIPDATKIYTYEDPLIMAKSLKGFLYNMLRKKETFSSETPVEKIMMFANICQAMEELNKNQEDNNDQVIHLLDLMDTYYDGRNLLLSYCKDTLKQICACSPNNDEYLNFSVKRKDMKQILNMDHNPPTQNLSV